MDAELAERIASALEGIELRLRKLLDGIKDIGGQVDVGAAKQRTNADRFGKRARPAEIAEWQRLREEGEAVGLYRYRHRADP